MRRSELDRLEAALRDLNPVPDPRYLVESDDAAAVALLVRERTARDTSPPRSIPAVAPARTSRMKPAWIFVAACLLALATIGLVTSMRSDQPGFADDPVPTTPSTAPTQAGVLINYMVRSTAIGPDGSLWAATEDGIIRWDLATTTATMFTAEDGLPSVLTHKVLVGPDGAVWTGNSGWIARYDGSWVTMGAPFDSNPMAIGPDGGVWTAFGRDRLARFDGSDWEAFEVPLPRRNGEATPWAASLDVAPDGTVWAAAHLSRGVFAFDGSDWTHYSDANGMPTGSWSTVATAPGGTVWFGSKWSGVARFDGSTWTHFTTEDGLLDMEADVAVGSDGTLWAIFDRGVARFSNGGWTSFPEVSGGGFGASVDDTGRLWMPAAEAGAISVIGFDGAETTRLEVPIAESQPTSSPAVTTIPVGEWDPILSTMKAKPSPPAATCPPGTDPNIAGPIDQERPAVGGVDMPGAVFDQRAGRIIYFDASGRTWAFDVCTNTWHRMNPTGHRMGGGLVYDVDSDVTVALGSDHISVYDASTNAWTQPDSQVSGNGDGPPWPMGAVYDPISGLIITSSQQLRVKDDDPDRWDIWAYDVESNDWTLIGAVPLERTGPCCTGIDLLGYSPSTDRLILTTYVGDHETTLLLDPRTGVTTSIPTDTPVVNLAWPSRRYGLSAATVYVTDAVSQRAGLAICGFDSEKLRWDCDDAPAAIASSYHSFSGIVGDPINHRLVLINGIRDDWGISDVWAVDQETGEWTQLLVPPDPVRER